ncbi:sensory histidine kinase AtoS [Serratia quinivorans]|uniref:ATP-binding protein n=1 Tax=Serratia quinivorans TaxID=137545 RepID=UPI00217CBC2B|nr:ATP-binding protein [Serratia quinivorans]CAI1795785.1 sensory histidine kinase AtoS [Serratia quinivorans]CAI1819065.1 sensory histidine kinase AtoS [Serratia quinivorans]
MDEISFQTRARTIDHLGREQIADCPTAISELWKNSFDAYAKKVELHIFNEKIPIAALVDDGHGMNRNEFERKWLTVGTESKAVKQEIIIEDMNGLPKRVKQGQKGIGRLSCAALGHLLLLISKRGNSAFVAALIDWRLFENPFIYLHDVKIPVMEFNDKEELYKSIPDLFTSLANNILVGIDDNVNDSEKERRKRLSSAWNEYESQELSEGKESTKVNILETIKDSVFTQEHLSKWPAWNEDSDRGTLMLLSGLHDDIIAQLNTGSILDDDGPTARARARFIQTLSNFTDPFIKDDEKVGCVNFTTSVTSWIGHICYPVIDEVKEFDINDLEDLEHIVDGRVDDNGYFYGRIKAFGEWFDDITIKPAMNYKTRADSHVGSFQIRLGSFEIRQSASTLTKEQHERFVSQTEKYAGLMIYRDSLRVMPYGREDNDYFEIEKRRSFHAGQHFWSNRRLFGRVAISRDNNPNLKDKAGREGLIDNRAAKIFREIVEKILRDTADRFFGKKSDLRSVALAEALKRREDEKIDSDRKKFVRKERARVKKAIEENYFGLKCLFDKLNDISDIMSINDNISDAHSAKKIKDDISDISGQLSLYSLSPVPKNLGSIEDRYKEYRGLELSAKDKIKRLDLSINETLDALVEKKDTDIALSIFRSKRSQLHAQIRKWSINGRQLLEGEINRFNFLVDERNKAFDNSLSECLEDLNLGRVTLSQALNKIDSEYELIESINRQSLSPYVTAIENIKEQIDLEGLAMHSLNESSKLREEINRLNGLAQLGITVEIVGHEIESFDMTIERGLKIIKSAQYNNVQKKAYEDVVFSHQGLSERLRFLSPLKLSGEKVRKTITGKDIYKYCSDFFGDFFLKNNISFTLSKEFGKFTIYDQPARLLPVFINLVNNARFWVCQENLNSREIMLHCEKNDVYISDSGPGVESSDLDSLFTLFFSRKPRGGRGVGLYLCKVNLQASGHTIRYENNKDKQVLSGANFVISFKEEK